MRKYFINAATILVLSMILFAGCKKEVTDPGTINSEEENATLENNRNEKNSCRLINLNWHAAGVWQFHYNDKGLADQWIIDFDFGTIKETIYYDNHERLIRAEEDFFGVANYVYTFYYSGKHLTRITRANVDLPEDASDFTLAYNWKGQIIRQDDNILDQHVLMSYDAIGNCTRTDIYFGSDLVFSDIYTFNKPVRNPKQNIPGVDIGFPFYGTGGITDKWWFTSNKTIDAFAGTPTLVNDYDPSKTTIETGNNHLPFAASYYDRVSQSIVDISFDYENCGQNHHSGYDGNGHANKSPGYNDASDHKPSLMLRGSTNSILEQVQRRRDQKKTGN